MAAKEMWDYLSATPVTPDYNALLDVRPHNVLPEEGDKNQSINEGDDNSDEVISHSDDSIFYVTLEWYPVDEADAGTVFDFYHDTAKANARARTFKWTNYAETSDPHTYTVRFVSPLIRTYRPPGLYEIANVRLKIEGRAP